MSNYIDYLPSETTYLILSNTCTRTLANISSVSSKWRLLSNIDLLWNLVIRNELISKGYKVSPSVANYPRNLIIELDRPSPFYKDKTVGASSFVFFKDPGIKDCKEWAYNAHLRQITELEKEMSLSQADWLLIPDNGVIPKSRRKSLGDQKVVIEKKDKSYRPATFFELSLAHFTKVSLGLEIPYHNPPVYSRCLSTNENNGKSIIMCSNKEKEIVAMPFFDASEVPNTGIIPIKELPYTHTVRECPPTTDYSR